MTNAALNTSKRIDYSQRLFFAELENATLKERLDKIRRTIQRKAPDLYDRMEAKRLFDLAIVEMCQESGGGSEQTDAASQEPSDPAE